MTRCSGCGNHIADWAIRREIQDDRETASFHVWCWRAQVEQWKATTNAAPKGSASKSKGKAGTAATAQPTVATNATGEL